jgi:splicing factor 3B subunit 1
MSQSGTTITAHPLLAKRKSRWDETPSRDGDKHADGQQKDDQKNSSQPVVKRSRWDETPATEGKKEVVDNDSKQDSFKAPLPVVKAEPEKQKRKSRWGEAPVPALVANNMVATPRLVDMGAATPVGTPALGLATPTPGQLGGLTPALLSSQRGEIEMHERNRPLTDEELDDMLPPGYKIVPPPEDYQPVRIPAKRTIAPSATPTPLPGPLATPRTGFFMQKEENYVASTKKIVSLEPKGNLPALKPEDLQYFDELLADVDEDSLPLEKQKERKIMRLLLKIKNGTPPVRKVALRQITDRARDFGAKALLDKILPILMSPSLEDQERHLLVKVIDRILYKLDDLVRPHVKKIMTVIAPLLIDEDYYSRIEGREVLSNLAKAAGLATMISTMRPDIDNKDEFVRNTTSRAFAVVASALGIPALLPFLRAVCKSKKSWQARHTGIKIIQQTTFLMGCAILPYSTDLVKTISHGLEDEQQKVRTIAALAIAAIAEACAPYGIEAFDPKTVLRSLYDGVQKFRGPVLAAYLKAIGHIIPLMDADLASMYTARVMPTLVREFASSDKNMKEIVLKVVEQCCSTEGVKPQYIKDEILPQFFQHYWNHRAALDRHNHRQLITTTVEMANKVGTSEIISRIVNDLKDGNEEYRKMVMETIEKVITNLGATDIDERLEILLIDGIVYAFQEQQAEDRDHIMLNGFNAVVSALGKRCKPYLTQITQIIKFRLNKSVNIRQQAADLMAKIAVVMKICNEEKLMSQMGLILYEYLGEEYPEVLGSILAALKAIVNVIGMHNMTPPIKDLLPRLTPILKNRHEKVQENCIDLVGRIADRGAEFGSPREWMRICFELLELLKAHKKAIRRATVNTFGYIAKAIGPHDVLATLLNNLKVQERQNRVCTTVAIAIVAETCGPFTILPALMNEYRVPELNVQNGVLKSLSFLFEYIGEMGKDYIYAILPLLQDALMDRDLVHRQTAMSVVQHMALGVHGFGCDDALTHLLNYIWPNIFETSPHVVQSFMGAIEGLRIAVGPIRLFQYTIQGLMHPARRVREVYWRIYNTLYIGGQDALVAAYPRIPDTEKNQYLRYELDYLV